MELASTLERIQSREISVSDIRPLLENEGSAQKTLLLYYMYEYLYPESAEEVQKWTHLQESIDKSLAQDDLIQELSKDAFAAAVELKIYKIAYNIALTRQPAVSSQTLLLLFQEEEVNLIKALISLGINIQGIKKTSSTRDVIKMLRLVFNEDLDQEPKLRLSDVLNFAFKNQIPLRTIKRLCVECQDLDDGSGIDTLLFYREEEEALSLLPMYETVVNSKSLLLAINNNCLKYAVEFAERNLPIKGSTSRVFSLLFRKISKDIGSEAGSLDIYLYIITRYLAEIELEDAIKFADAVDFIISPETAADHIWKLLNPLKFIVQLIELAIYFSSHFDNMRMRFEKIMADLTQLGLDILEEVKADQQMKFILLDKDLENRDSLGRILEHHLIDFLGNTMVEKIANEVWNGPYDFTRNPLYPTSSLWKLVTHNKVMGEKDVESRVRKKLFARSIEAARAHQFEYSVWRSSAGLRVLFLVFEYVILTVGLFVSELFNRNDYYTMDDISLAAEGREFTPEEDAEYYRAILSIRNWTFWWDICAISMFIASARLFTYPLFQFLTGRRQQIFTLEWVMDLAIFISMFIIYVPLTDDVVLGMEHIRLEGEELIRLVEEMQDDPVIIIFTAIIAFCLGLRIAYMLRYTNFFGPMITIMKSMIRKILEFSIFFFIVLFVFSLAATLLFSSEEPGFERIDYIMLTLFQSSIGVFDINPPEKYAFEGKIFYVIFVCISNIMLLNFVIAILNEIYSDMAPKSKSTLYKEVISLREQYKPHKVYQFMVSSYFIYDVLFCILFLPIYPFLRPKAKQALNAGLLYLEYALAFIIILPFYIAAEAVLIPIGYLVAMFNKTRLLIKKGRDAFFARRLASVLLFFVFGFLVLLFYMLVDIYYFILHSFAHRPTRKVDKEVNDYIDVEALKDVIDYLKDFSEEDVPLDTVIKGVEVIFSRSDTSSIMGNAILRPINRILWVAQYATLSRYIRHLSNSYHKKDYVNVRNLCNTLSNFLRVKKLRLSLKQGFKKPPSVPVNGSIGITVFPNSSQSFMKLTKRSEINTKEEGPMPRKKILVTALKLYDKELYKKGVEKYCVRDTSGVKMPIQVNRIVTRLDDICAMLSRREMGASVATTALDAVETKKLYKIQ